MDEEIGIETKVGLVACEFSAVLRIYSMRWLPTRLNNPLVDAIGQALTTN